jgi:hypothetical protein
MANIPPTSAENISQRINIDVAHYINEHPKPNVDELLLVAAAPAAHADYSKISLKEMRRIMIAMKIFVKHRSRYKNYSKKATIEGLRNEWIPELEDEEKAYLLEDIKVIGKDAIGDDWTITPDKTWFEKFAPLNTLDRTQYGTQVYKKPAAAKKVKIKVETVKPDTNLEEKLAPYIKWYKGIFDNYIYDHEHYKWVAIDTFQKRIPDLSEFDKDTLETTLAEALSKSANLLSAPHYYAQSTLLKASKNKIASDDVKSALLMLYNEELPLAERADKFISQFKEIVDAHRGPEKTDETFGPKDTSQQDMHAVSVYLSFMYPDKHFFYKESMWSRFQDTVGLGYPLLNAYEHKLVGFEGLCRHIRSILMADKELIEMHDMIYDGSDSENHPKDYSNYNLLTQDFIYAVAVHLEILGDNVE